MSQEKSFETWLRRQIFLARVNPLEKLVLRSATPGSAGQEIEEFIVPHEGWNSDNISALRDDILSRAQVDADGMGNKIQRYVVMALEQGETKGPRFPFRVRSENDDDGEEAPNEKGIISQLMRHNEVMMRAMTIGNAAQMQHLTRQIEILSSQNASMMEKQINGFQALEEAKNEQHSREIEMMSVGAAEERKNAATDKVLQKVDLLLPAIIGKITNKPLLTEPQNNSLQTLINTMTPAQLSQLQNTFTPEQLVLFGRMVEETKQK